MRRIEAIADAHVDIAAALVDIVDIDPIDDAIDDHVAIGDAASHAVIDGPASAQCSC